MDTLIRFQCPSCGKKLKALAASVGRRVRCTRPTCGLVLHVPGEVFDLDDESPLDLDSPFEPDPLPPLRLKGPPKRRFPWGTMIGLAGVALIAAGVFGGYWWVGQPTTEQVEVYENFIRTSNELLDMHEAIKDEASARAAESKLEAKAKENLEFMKQRHAMPKSRKKDRLEARYRPKIDEILKRLAILMTSNKPILVLPSTTDRGEYMILRLGSLSNGSGTSGTSTTSTSDPKTRIAALAGTWDADNLSLIIKPDGTGEAFVLMSSGNTYTQFFGYFTLDIKNGDPHIAFELVSGSKTFPFEFTVLPVSNASQLVVREAAGRVTPNPLTMKRAKDDLATPAPTPQPPSEPKPAPIPSSGKVGFSDLKITRMTFDPPSVEFTIRLDLAGGELLEAWASVGITDASPALEVFAGALHQGLLGVNGIDFSNPDPSLKAQRVTMKRSVKDPNLYECKVHYPQLVLADPVTEFTIVAAVEKDKKIVKTNAAMVKVNLKTGEVVGSRK
jgi:hypothetical protein